MFSQMKGRRFPSKEKVRGGEGVYLRLNPIVVWGGGGVLGGGGGFGVGGGGGGVWGVFLFGERGGVFGFHKRQETQKNANKDKT